MLNGEAEKTYHHIKYCIICTCMSLKPICAYVAISKIIWNMGMSKFSIYNVEVLKKFPIKKINNERKKSLRKNSREI